MASVSASRKHAGAGGLRPPELCQARRSNARGALVCVIRKPAGARPLSRRRAPAILSEQVVQPGAEHVEILAQSVQLDVGSLQFTRRLLAGGEQED